VLGEIQLFRSDPSDPGTPIGVRAIDDHDQKTSVFTREVNHDAYRVAARKRRESVPPGACGSRGSGQGDLDLQASV